MLSDGNVPGCVALVVPGLCVDPCLGQDPDQLPLAHGGRDVQGRVPVLVHGGHPAPGADQDPRDPHVTIPGRGVEGGVTILKQMEQFVTCHIGKGSPIHH